jgi:molecular chaperone GrpE
VIAMTTPSNAEPRPSDAGAVEPTAAEDTADEDAGVVEPAAAELAQVEDRWRRALADAENLRKRLERQIADQLRAERARTAAAFLPVLDNLELALRHAAADPGSIVAGVDAVRDLAVEILRRLGYRRSEPVGERFDPAVHEAARVVEADGSEPGTIVEVLQPGYLDAGGAPVRPARVTVAGGPK